ncbi:glycosyltransferase family 2 protein (plasmid) [Haloferax sp. S1W]|uniref:glycosyltransferase family 2 protein n=1 Tax=Haloferax sp. S1W TaxID=3377110 RepID=UPI0037CB35A9
MDPLVSVVIPTYGRPEFVTDAVQSVATQSYSRIELLVVDDHSPEPVAPTLERVDTSRLVRTVVLRHDENRGANAARNTGIRESGGDIIAFLDDDDWWQPTVVEQYVETFRESPPDVGLVSVGVRVEDTAGRQIGAHRPNFDGDPLDILLRGTLVGSFSRFSVTRDVVEKAGLPDELLPSWQDWEWQFRLARHCKFASVSEPLVVRTEGTHEQITDDFEERRDVSYPRILARHRDAIAAERGRRGERQFVALLSRTLGTSALHAGRYSTAISYLLKSLRSDPTQLQTYLFLVVALGGPLTNRYGRQVKRRLSGVF